MASATATLIEIASHKNDPDFESCEALSAPFNRHAHKRLRNQKPNQKQGKKHSSTKSGTVPNRHPGRSARPTNLPTDHSKIESSQPPRAHQAEGTTVRERPEALEPATLNLPKGAEHGKLPVPGDCSQTIANACTKAPTPVTVFIDSLLFHLTNLANIESRQSAEPDRPLSQSHHRSLARAFRFAIRWSAAIDMPTYSRDLAENAPAALPVTSKDADRWLQSLAHRIFSICDRHMAASYDLLKNDPTRTATTTDLNFDSLRDRVSNLEGFFTIDQQVQSGAGFQPASSVGASSVDAASSRPIPQSKQSIPPGNPHQQPPKQQPTPAPSRVPACPQQGRREAAESEGAHKQSDNDQATRHAPSDAEGTRRTKGMGNCRPQTPPSLQFPTTIAQCDALLAALSVSADPNGTHYPTRA